jgi:hypothetical protein
MHHGVARVNDRVPPLDHRRVHLLDAPEGAAAVLQDPGVTKWLSAVR